MVTTWPSRSYSTASGMSRHCTATHFHAAKMLRFGRPGSISQHFRCEKVVGAAGSHGGRRPPEQKALPQLDVELAQRLQLAVALDPFGDEPAAGGPPEVAEAGDQG